MITLLYDFLGGSSSATSVTSNSTAETKPSSAILNPLSTQYSPAESPDSTKRRSCVSLGNNSSNSKSSSNLTGSTKSDQGKFNQNSMVNCQVIIICDTIISRDTCPIITVLSLYVRFFFVQMYDNKFCSAYEKI